MWSEIYTLLVVLFLRFFFFWHELFFKSSLNLLQYCFCSCFGILATRHLGSQVSDQGLNQHPYIKMQSLKVWTSRAVPPCGFKMPWGYDLLLRGDIGDISPFLEGWKTLVSRLRRSVETGKNFPTDAPCTLMSVLIICLIVGMSSWCKSDLPVTGSILKSIFLTIYKTAGSPCRVAVWMVGS